MSFNDMEYNFSENNSSTMKFSNNNMDCSILEHNMNNEIFIIKSKLEVKEEFKIESSTNVNGLMLGYNLFGYSEHKNINSGHHLRLSANESNMSIVNNEHNISSVSKGISNKIGIVVKKEFIEKNINDNMIKDLFLSSLEKESCDKLMFHKKTDPYMNLILNDIYKLSFDEPLNNISLQSKVLELLFLEFTSLSNDKKSIVNNIKLDDYDIEAIKKAKDILIQNMKNPPSILQLAKMVRINDFKLKIGFKEIFKITPYNLLLNYRLEYAKKLLIESHLSIGEIAQDIGYKYTASFSAAFIKKYGITPTSIMKTRKYYY
ncbi:AraC family transcriptional regulator [Sulfurimonas sp.]|uniref:helix-turn-helix domain-containing protein n=1 Tax=Sulfurimonas sp. TaxID=2022749 RepID=UPI002B4A07E7|nr:AraC family transcriptional regulator [Sulfurimonas sp.]